jgi:hypothetical protein
MPLRPRHGYAADLHRGLRAGDMEPTEEFLAQHRRASARRCPAPIRQVRAGGMHLRGFLTLVSHVHRPVLLAEPARSDGAAPVSALSGLLSALAHVSGVRLPSALFGRCDGPTAVSFHHRTVEQRLVALHAK